MVAAQTAAYYAGRGVYIDNLVLVGSPISAEFLMELKGNPNIGSVMIKDLGFNGDPIYAGMAANELMGALPVLLNQFLNVEDGVGHFYYNPDTEEGGRRRLQLAEDLFEEGIR